MAFETVKPLRSAWPMFGLLLLLLVILHLMSGAVQGAEGLSRLFVPLLLIALVGLLFLALLIFYNGIRLWNEYRRRQTGSRLTLRMVLVFLFLSLPPVSVVYYYSMEILLKGIDRWFDVDIGASVEDSLKLAQASLDLHKREKIHLTNYLWDGLRDSNEASLSLSLDVLRERFDVHELLLLDGNNQLVASSSANPMDLAVSIPEPDVLLQVRSGQPYVTIEPNNEEGALMVRVVVAEPDGRPLLLQAMYRTSQQITNLSANAERSYRRYRELEYLRDSLKFSFSLSLLLVLIYVFLTAIWAAFFFARRLVAPVAQIAEGTRTVAEGNYGKQLPVPETGDELSFLVASFNSMTHSIAAARDMAERSQQEVETQRSYLQTVLGRLSSGVMAFDSQLSLQTANPAAKQILGVDLTAYLGKPLQLLAEELPQVYPFVEAIMVPLRETHGEWRDEVSLITAEGRHTLLCSVTPLAMHWDEAAGHVVVFDDVSALIQAQKDAAWGGVARRLAHEIKNPLTPIQLSAERLRHKFLARLPEEEAQMLDRATRTIVQQVETMKEMVNAFSDYARPPKMQLQPVEIDPFVNDALDLYRSAGVGPVLEVSLNAAQVRVEADPSRLRRVVVNLVKNAQEAVAEREQGEIRVATELGAGAEEGYVALVVRDNGPGFSIDVMQHLFEPYMTTKSKGTGLGLAIVKKIVEEHGGMIRAENLVPVGARILIYLPLLGRAADGRMQNGFEENNVR